MDKRNIIVVGASAGGFEAMKVLISGLPQSLDASVFIVWHMPADVRGVLPQVLNKLQGLFAAHAVDMEPVKPGRIYVAPPDHHLVLEDEYVRVTRGPKENRFRPAIDPLFRSAALAYGSRVIGIILSGALDDGSMGLWTVKQYGGVAMVQDPSDADVPSMPQNAIRSVEPDYVLPVAEMAAILTRMIREPVPTVQGLPEHHERTKFEIGIAMEKRTQNHLLEFGELSPYTCPECHGVLSSFQEGRNSRFRCHTGHSFSVETLLASVTETIEESIWSAVRSVQESVLLLNHIGDHFAETNQPKLAALYFRKAASARERVELLRKAVLQNERLSTESVIDARA